MPSRPTREVLAENINALMKVNLSLDSNPKLSDKSALGTGSISRIRNADGAVNLDTLDKLAKCFELQAWQLLVPEMDPTSPRVLRCMSDTEYELWQRMRSMIKQLP